MSGSRSSRGKPEPTGRDQAVLPELSEYVIGLFLRDHFRSVNLLRDARASGRRADRHISSNEEFWSCLIAETTRPLSRVRIGGSFQLVDWFPRSPGLFHTREAEQHRLYAEQYLRTIDGVVHYEP